MKQKIRKKLAVILCVLALTFPLISLYSASNDEPSIPDIIVLTQIQEC